MKLLCDTLYAVINIKSAVYDRKYLKVKNNTYLIILSLSLLKFIFNKEKAEVIITESLISVVVIFPILLFAIMTNGVGGGDIKFIFCNMLYLGVQEEINALIICFIILSMYVLQKRKRKQSIHQRIPLLPFMMIGNIIILIITRI